MILEFIVMFRYPDNGGPVKRGGTVHALVKTCLMVALPELLTTLVVLYGY